jgi:hypothetical protein
MHVQVVGLERLVSVNENGLFTLTDLPAGVYTLRIVTADTFNVKPMVIGNVQAQSGKIVEVPLAGWKKSTALRINTTMNGAGVAGDIHDFPLLIRIDSTLFGSSKAVFDFFGQCAVNGSDLRFANKKGKSFSYEIDQWDPIGGKAAIWVRVDTIRGNDATQYFWMYWGKTTAVAHSEGFGVFDTAHGYASAWHCNLSTGSTIVDASAAANNGVLKGQSSTPLFITSPLQSALSVDSQYVVTTSRFAEGPQVLSLSLWFKTSRAGGKLIGFVSDETDTSLKYDRQIYMDTAGFLHFGVYPSYSGALTRDDSAFAYINSSGQLEGIRRILSHNVAVNDNRWHHAAVTLSSQGQFLYVDGKLSQSNTNVTGAQNFSGLWMLGGGKHTTWEWHSPDPFFHGALDEVRIMHYAVNADWVKLSFENQSEGSTVVTIRNE